MFNKSQGLLGALGFSGVSHMLTANMRSNHGSSDPECARQSQPNAALLL